MDISLSQVHQVYPDAIETANHKGYHAACPHCAAKGIDNSKKKLFVYKNSGFVVCFRCGYMDKFHAEYNVETIYNGVMGMLKYETRDFFDVYSPESEDEDYASEYELSYIYDDKRAIDYLYKVRKLNNEQINHFGLTSVVNQQAIGIPVIYNHKIVAYTYRFYNKNAYFRYKFEDGFQKNKYLFNYDYLRDKDYVVLCEGQISAMSQFPEPSCATFGKELSSMQYNLLLNSKVKTVYLCYEWDNPQSVIKAANKLRDKFDVYILMLPYLKDSVGLVKYLDPNDVSPNKLDLSNNLFYDSLGEIKFKTILQSL